MGRGSRWGSGTQEERRYGSVQTKRTDHIHRDVIRTHLILVCDSVSVIRVISEISRRTPLCSSWIRTTIALVWGRGQLTHSTRAHAGAPLSLIPSASFLSLSLSCWSSTPVCVAAATVLTGLCAALRCPADGTTPIRSAAQSPSLYTPRLHPLSMAACPPLPSSVMLCARTRRSRIVVIDTIIGSAVQSSAQWAGGLHRELRQKLKQKNENNRNNMERIQGDEDCKLAWFYVSAFVACAVGM